MFAAVARDNKAECMADADAESDGDEAVDDGGEGKLSVTQESHLPRGELHRPRQPRE